MKGHAALTTTALLAALVFGGCVAPLHGAAGTAPRLYVLNGLDGTVTPLDSGSGSVIGPSVPAGPSPAQLAPGPAGTLLSLSFTSRVDPGQLFHVTLAPPARRPAPTTRQSVLASVDAPAGPTASGAVRPLAAGLPLRQALIAGDGRRFAAVVYHDPPSPPSSTSVPNPRCHLALIDVRTGEARRTHTVCGPQEQINGLAVEALVGGGVVAYLNVWDVRSEGPRNRDRIVALDAESGAVLATLPLAGPSEHLVLAQSSDQTGARLYLVEPVPGAESEYTVTGHWRLLVLDPATLAVERHSPIGVMLRRLAIAPDGRHAYALTAAGTAILHLDLATKQTRHLTSLPGDSVSLAVTAEYVYVPNPHGDSVWQLRRRDGRLLTAIPTGRRPIAVYAFPAQ